MTEKPICELIGTDGNVFAIIRKVCDTLDKNALREQADEFRASAFKSNSYNDVLILVHEYVEVE